MVLPEKDRCTRKNDLTLLIGTGGTVGNEDILLAVSRLSLLNEDIYDSQTARKGSYPDFEECFRC